MIKLSFICGGVGEIVGEVGGAFVELIVLDSWGSLVGFSELEGEIMIYVRAVRYCAYVDFESDR